MSFTNNNTDDSNTRTVGDIVLERHAYVVRTRSGSERLTRAEFAVLDLLMKRPERVYTHDEVATAYIGDGYRVTDTAVRVLIHRVRRKLGDNGGQLQALRGVGFFISEQGGNNGSDEA
ncbi:MAG: helix-turn-helix domain-containing protein [Planctomycetota bacterium]